MVRYSIIIPMYNAAGFIENTLASILHNDTEQCEIILVDDGSEDNCAAIASNYLDREQFGEYKLVQQENSGVSAARNRGIREATGEYLIFCDSDDCFTKDCFGELQKYSGEDMIIWKYYIEQHGTRVSSDTADVSKDTSLGDASAEPVLQEYTFSGVKMMEKFLLEGCRIRLGSFSVRREIVVNKGLQFVQGCNYGEDVEFIIKCLGESENVRYLTKHLFIYEKRDGSLMYQYRIERFDACLAAKRAAQYCQGLESVKQNEKLMEYLHHGFFVLHAIFSFDGCMKYLNKQNISTFWTDYKKHYPQLESQIKDACKSMKTAPLAISQKKLMLFMVLPRRLYIWLYLWK